MNRFHVHLNVADLSASIGFYSRLFAAEPAIVKADYAKWMLDDPRVNFAISTTGRSVGIDHLGIQAETAEELSVLGVRLHAAGGTVTPEPSAICCYAQSDKLWIEDPQGTRWETFHTFGEATSYYSKDAACGSADVACGTSPGTVMPNAETPGSTCCGSTSASCC